MSNKNLVFVLSGGRTGTKFLGDLLSKVIEDCHSEHEPDLFLGWSHETRSRLRTFGLWHMIGGRALGRTGLRVVGMQHLTGNWQFNRVRETIRAQRRPYFEGLGESLVIESYYAWWMLGPELRHIYPASKIVGVVRDPRTWISSWQARSTGRDRGHWTHMFPPGPLTPRNIGDEQYADRWEGLGPIGRLAWQWATINAKLLAAQKTAEARIYRFEDVFDPNTGALYSMLENLVEFADRTYAFSDPTPLISDRRNASDASGEEWRSWSSADKNVVLEICASLAETFGYDLAELAD